MIVVGEGSTTPALLAGLPSLHCFRPSQDPAVSPRDQSFVATVGGQAETSAVHLDDDSERATYHGLSRFTRHGSRDSLSVTALDVGKCGHRGLRLSASGCLPWLYLTTSPQQSTSLPSMSCLFPDVVVQYAG